MHLNFEVIVTL